MDDLPILVYKSLFQNYFSVKERLELKLVCKRWKLLIEFWGQENLVICPKDTNCVRSKCLDSGKFIIPADVLYIPITRYDFSDPIFRKLEKIYFFKCEESETKRFLENLDQLPELTCLCFRESRFSRLRSATLRELYLRDKFGRSIDLETPNLVRFVFHRNRHSTVVNFSHPDRVRFVECEDFNFESLANIEQLVCRTIGATINLENFKKLKKIEICPLRRDEEDKEMVRRLKRQFGHVVFVDGLENTEEFFFKNQVGKLGLVPKQYDALANVYSSITRMPWPFTVDYCSLVKSFQKIPDDFTDKFCQISTVHITKSVDSAKLIRFLERTNVKYLGLRVEFDQVFYNELANRVKTTEYLEMVFDFERINLNFLKYSKLLRSIEIQSGFSQIFLEGL